MTAETTEQTEARLGRPCAFGEVKLGAFVVAGGWDIPNPANSPSSKWGFDIHVIGTASETEQQPELHPANEAATSVSVA